MMRVLGSPVYKLLERSGVYSLGQWVGRPTVRRFRQLIRENIAIAPEQTVLDLGCGVGGYRDCFTGRYHGIDINPDYIATAQTRYSGEFRVMSCTDLNFMITPCRATARSAGNGRRPAPSRRPLCAAAGRSAAADVRPWPG